MSRWQIGRERHNGQPRRGRGVGLLRVLGLALVCACATGAAAPAANGGPLDGWASDNVELVANVPLPGAGSAYRSGDYLYVIGVNGIESFDISKPTRPEHLASLVSPAGHWGCFENPDGNDQIIVICEMRPTDLQLAAQERDPGILAVIDIRDPRSPSVLSRLAAGGDHTLTCLHDCEWVYSGTIGKIIDLRDPTEPRMASARWTDGLEFHYSPVPRALCPPLCGGSNDVTEVAPGRVLTASVPMYLLDTTDPLRPRVLAKSDGSPYARGGVVWPDRGRSPLILSFQEPTPVFPSNCRARALFGGTSVESGFKTWRARGWKTTELFVGLDEYFARDGTYVDGNPPASPPVPGCVAQWPDPHPSFGAGGLVVLPYAGNGTKFLHVTRAGFIREVGFWLPRPPSTTVSAYWITDDIVYTVDLYRGIDILRFDRDLG